MPTETFVIVGASLAGAKAAETLRAEGFGGHVVLIGAEQERPYERPPLSKDYLRGEADHKPFVHEESYYADNEIDLRTGIEATRIDPAASRVHLSDGETLAFDRLLLTTGSEPRRLSLPGSDLDGVHYLRTVEDSDAIRRRIDAGGKLVTIGAGWIGAEAAASARQRGCDVTIVEMTEVPLERVVGRELGAFYRDVHVDHGVEFIGAAAVEAIEGDGTVSAVRLAGDRRIAADFVVIGIGIQPRVRLAEEAGLEVADGIVCDDHLRTSAPSVYAAGDAAAALHPHYGGRIRVEHWANALNQGPAAARNMLGRDEPYARIPYFFSDQYDVGMEYSGYATRWDQVVFRGDPSGGEFIAFWLDGERVVAGMNVNVWDVTDAIQALIRDRVPVDPRVLADQDTPLEQIIAV
jgi:3-phenylpropionate/trans-cinnamate dioxygenase ferredoxin reductase subunit